MHVKSEDNIEYLNRTDDTIIKQALAILELRMITRGDALTSPNDSRNYLRLKLSDKKAESFCVLFLDNRHRVIEFREMFQGTIDGTSVHPREVIRAGLEVNAAAVILSHNHPSGIAEPSLADISLTKRLVEALKLMDIRVLDHIIVGDDLVSMAERGLI